MEARKRPPPEDAQVARMREHWRAFAREDAMHYVAANRERWDPDAFYAMGADLARDVLEWAGEGIGRARMAEIGCGAGRMLVHFASHFERVDGLDIAPEMLERARPHMPANVHLHVVDGAALEPLPDARTDLVLAVQVFQHIPERAVVAAYIAECARVLKRGGRAVLQFDSRPNPLIRRLALRLPDSLLPRDRRRYIRRYPVPAEWPAEVARSAGLAIVDQRAPDSEDHMLLVEQG